MLERLTYESFAGHLQTSFQVEDSSGNVVILELVEATALPSAPPISDAFSVLFRGPSSVFAPQGIYHFQHEALGEFELFIVPVRQASEGYYYEAAFNRVTPPEES